MCDNWRLHSEHNTNFLKGILGSHGLYDKERIDSNNLSFRKKNFENILISYQSKSPNMSEEFYQQRLEQLYSAFDEAAVGIESTEYFRSTGESQETLNGKNISSIGQYQTFISI